MWINLILAFFIISPKIGTLDLTIAPLLFLVIVTLMLKKLRCPPSLILDLKGLSVFIYVNIIWIFIFCLALFAFIYHGQVASSVFLKPIRQVLIASCLLFIFLNINFTRVDLFNVVLLAASINAFVVLVQYLSGLFIPGSHGDFLMHPEFNSEINMAWRKPGLFSGYPHSAVLSAFGAIVGFYFLFNKITISYFIAFTMCFVTLLLSSRTGMILGLLGITLLFPPFISARRVNLLVFTSFVLVVAISIFYVVQINPVLLVTFEMMFELFINLFKGQGLSSASQSDLYSSFGYPVEKVSTLIFGNGLPHNADNLLNVDAGFQQSLFGGGFIHLVLIYLIFFIMMFTSVKNVLKLTVEKFIVLMFFAFIFISNLKGGFLFSRGPADVLILFFVFSITEKYFTNQKMVFIKYK